MRCLLLVARTGHAPGLDGVEVERPLVVGERAAIAAKVPLERLVLPVFWMRVATMTVGLPDLDGRVIDGLAVAIDDATAERDALAGDALRRNVFDLHPLESDAQVWTDGLRRA